MCSFMHPEKYANKERSRARFSALTQSTDVNCARKSFANACAKLQRGKNELQVLNLEGKIRNVTQNVKKSQETVKIVAFLNLTI